jgi:RND family efflux transporter MFP subunit
MNKYVLRTSLFWLALIAVVGFIVLFRSHRSEAMNHNDIAVQPIARGPSQPQAQSTVHPSTSASAGPELVPIHLSPERLQSIGVETAVVERGPLTEDIRATGTVAINERLLSYVQVRFSGYIRRVFANAPLQFVKKGDPLFTIYSPELVAAENEYLVALRNQTRLQSSSLEGVAEGASELLSSAKARLRQWDVPATVIQQVEESGAPVTEMVVRAPASGFITERNALPNLYVEPATRLYTLADLSRVWVDAQLFPEDISRVKPGNLGNLTLDSYPGHMLRARIEAILPQVDLTTRTGRVRLDLPNPDLRLKPGMYVNVDLKVSLGTQVTVPATSVLTTGTRSIAFLDHGNGQLVPQDVEPGQRIGERVIILKGLSVGQKVVSSANFLVDSESQLQSAASAFSPPAPGTGATTQPAQPQLNIDLTTAPSPPQKGNNQFQVKLTDPQGKAVPDASVTVVFYMAAMPAMGMAAMTTKMDLQPSSSGVYTGSGVLGSGGTWQVTVTARRNGSVIATKQMSINATGGM